MLVAKLKSWHPFIVLYLSRFWKAWDMVVVTTSTTRGNIILACKRILLLLLIVLLSIAFLGNSMNYPSREWNVQVLKPVRKGSNRMTLVPLPKNDNVIVLDDSVSIRSFAYGSIHHKMATILSVILWGRFLCHILFPTKMLIPTSMTRSEGLIHRIPFMIIIAFLYLLESFFSSTRRYLSNVLDIIALQRLMEQVTLMQPIIKWHMECYHYNTVLRPTGSGGTMRTERTKVVTHRAVERYTYQR
jgi:hypothetical protein